MGCDTAWHRTAVALHRNLKWSARQIANQVHKTVKEVKAVLTAHEKRKCDGGPK
jgi:hypothetical protein